METVLDQPNMLEFWLTLDQVKALFLVHLLLPFLVSVSIYSIADACLEEGTGALMEKSSLSYQSFTCRICVRRRKRLWDYPNAMKVV